MGFIPRVRAIWARIPQRREPVAAPYQPRSNGQPDPGEVVWAWVPYEEDPRQGKDRPVLVLRVTSDAVIGLALTSKDHDRDADQEAEVGRYWMDIGSGSWDTRGRPSEVRLNRVLSLSPDDVRREGGRVSAQLYEQVLRAAEPYLD
ncbi:MAG TPA: type II toxin-antitoxin system PemK/MazF family toxin [Marmoricola sp.]|nr:type II toxin-antitoxin system PemK/MazF family toxin [Marmoricola sp.]HNJ79354.1 type II toxin-antitoxin system PemK/MazF family toxin [Marmoricola sp.]HNO39133.1 type II toxin-antitoxin system PemK/MazF family toxin [Marmoricola sp.]